MEALDRNSFLTELQMIWCGVREAGMLVLEAMLRRTAEAGEPASLQTVDLTSNPVTTTAAQLVDVFHEEFPNATRVHHS